MQVVHIYDIIEIHQRTHNLSSLKLDYSVLWKPDNDILKLGWYFFNNENFIFQIFDNDSFEVEPGTLFRRLVLLLGINAHNILLMYFYKNKF